MTAPMKARPSSSSLFLMRPVSAPRKRPHSRVEYVQVIGLTSEAALTRPGGPPDRNIGSAGCGQVWRRSALRGWWVDGQRPDLRDALGVGVTLLGAAIMMWPRSPVAG